MIINPLDMKISLQETLQRYIQTALPISRKYPRLKQQFREMLQEKSLVAGPFVEALPDFEKGASLHSLLKSQGGFLHDALGSLPQEIVNRALHKHQEDALTKACRDEKSLLVATGTGSGKTETFLYPVANMLLNDPEPQEDGIRVLLLYPMNALANDQLLYRIAPLFAHELLDHGITFGRFTSQIKATSSRADEEDALLNNDRLMEVLGHPSCIPQNWLLTRDEMFATPPKVLLTNYAMLEHLLLLPRNSPLFNKARLRCIVMDEIHTYSGAQATEVAFLLRKLKNHLGIQTPLQVFGTSASLSAGDGADEGLITFAENLFGEKVHDVVRGKRIVHGSLTDDVPTYSLPIDFWCGLEEKIDALTQADNDTRDDAVEAWNAYCIASQHDELQLNTESPIESQLFLLYKNNNEIRKIACLLEQKQVRHFQKLAQDIFPNAVDSISTKALTAVVKTGILARQNPHSFPLLPARYHLAVNGIEGLWVTLSTEGEGWHDIKPYRMSFDEEGRPYYPLMVCRRCGQPFVEGYKSSAHLFGSREVDSTMPRTVLWLGTELKSQTNDEEDEASDEVAAQGKGSSAKGKKNKAEQEFLNVENGRIGNVTGPMFIPMQEVLTATDEIEQRAYVKKCPACGGSAGNAIPEIVTAMSVGNEALGAVVTHEVLQALSPDSKNSSILPSQGRTLLTFSDSRQDAAYFAPFFEHTSNQFAVRSAIFKELQRLQGDSISFSELSQKVFRKLTKQMKLYLPDGTGKTPKSSSAQRDMLESIIAAEFCTPSGRRNSLEALGCVAVRYEEEAFAQLVKKASAIMPRDKELTENLCLVLLEGIRRMRAISKPCEGDADFTDGSIWGAYTQSTRTFEAIRTSSSKGGPAFAWMPSPKVTHSAANSRIWILVERLGWTTEEAKGFLEAFWDILKKTKFLENMKPGFVLDINKIQLEYGLSLPLYICPQCGVATFFPVGNKCATYRCTGNVQEFSAEERKRFLEEHHYLYMYQHKDLHTLRASEHTASLSTELRSEIEAKFGNREINLLSCTTTMEMGVDLGELEAVVCLNVPPGISNYQQRTGRAGRRAQAAPFCVTVAKSSRYDQSVFADFHKYLVADPPIPYIHMQNEQLFLRHQLSIVLAGFLQHRIHDLKRNTPNLAALLGETLTKGDVELFCSDLTSWLEQSQGQKALAKAESLRKTITPYELGFESETLQKYFAATLISFAQKIAGRWQEYQTLQDEAVKNNELTQASRWQKQQKAFLEQFLVNQLSANGLIPTYSFPVHSISLEVNDEMGGANAFRSAEIALTRNAVLGISEYAPGSQVVANGRVRTSAGVAYMPKQFMPVEYFKVCSQCNHVEVAVDASRFEDECPYCGNSRSKQRAWPFIKPTVFVTAYEDRQGKHTKLARPRRLFADEARLLTQPVESAFKPSDHNAVKRAFLSAALDASDRGDMFIVNRGPHKQGFVKCPRCGYTVAATHSTKKIVHDDIRNGKKCMYDSKFEPICLAHTFSTDIVIFAFQYPLPDEEGDSAKIYKSLCTTVAEAMRFAAASLLHVQDSELRATYKQVGARLEVILYDVVPGGAGYSKRLMETPVAQLLKKTVERLSCGASCNKSCRQCLNDYSNQRHWDIFDRKIALKWISSVVDYGKASLVKEIKQPHQKLMEGSSRHKNVEVLDFSVGSTRDISHIFAPLKGQKIEKLLVIDQDCGTGDAKRKKTADILSQLVNFASSVKSIDLYCKEAFYSHYEYEDASAVETDFMKLLEPLCSSASVRVVKLYESQSMHDRCIQAIVIDNEGLKKEYCYNLSGELSDLFDFSKAVKIFFQLKF